MANLAVDETSLRRWAAQASLIDERLAGLLVGQDAASEEAARSWSAWRQAAAKGDPQRFGAYQTRMGLAEADVLPRLGAVRWADDRPLPDWALSLPDLIAIIGEGQASPVQGLDTPFSGLFRPIGRAIFDHVSSGWTPSTWSASVADSIEIEAARRLAMVFTDSLYNWFDAFRSVRKSHAGAGGPDSGTGSPTEIYDDFLAWLRGGHFSRLLDRHPVLARLLAVFVQQWRQHVGEVVTRLEQDREAIVDRFFAGRDPGPVTSLDLGVSDPHDHGRGVVIVAFASGDRVVYKPRDLKIDQAWGQFLQWLNDAGGPVDLKTPDVLHRPGYGWVTFVQAAPCADQAQVRAFFRRSGTLLALFQMMGGCDFHQDNVIACGDHPMAIDLETLLRPDVLIDDQHPGLHPAVRAARKLTTASVIECGYLPYWNEFRDQKWIGGGLGWFIPEPVQVTRYQHPNTDAMVLGPVALPAETIKHLPTLDGQVADPLDFVSEIQDGLEATSRFLLAHRQAVARAMEVFRGATIRPVLRDTQFYEFLRNRALQPSKLASGLDFSLEFEFLMRFHQPTDIAAVHQVQAERKALSRLDIPLFRMGADDTTLCEAGGGCFEATRGRAASLPPLRHALARLDALDEALIDEQRRLVRFSLTAHRLASWDQTPWPETRAPRWSADTAIARAVRLGEQIVSAAVVREDGAAWLGVATEALSEPAKIHCLGDDFYDGSGGIAVFLMALAKITGRADFQDMGLRALAPLRRRLADRAAHGQGAGVKALGGATGLGSMIYPLVLCADLAQCPEFLDDAAFLAEGLTDALIAQDTQFDVVGGAAGAILGLVALHEAGRPIGLDRAAACGRHLLRHAPPSGSAGPGAQPLAGLSHGAAGLAYALQVLAKACGHEAFAAAAAQWTAYEASLYDQAAGNWRDIRFVSVENPNPDVSICRWCHGAAGVGLARLGMDLRPAPAAIAADIDRALERTIAEPMGDLDSLCCGNFGRIATLLEAGLRLKRPRLIALARERAAARLAQTPQGFRWMVGADSENLGFFQGVAGVGYELLRLARPDDLPCALLWKRQGPSWLNTRGRTS